MWINCGKIAKRSKIGQLCRKFPSPANGKYKLVKYYAYINSRTFTNSHFDSLHLVKFSCFIFFLIFSAFLLFIFLRLLKLQGKKEKGVLFSPAFVSNSGVLWFIDLIGKIFMLYFKILGCVCIGSFPSFDLNMISFSCWIHDL